ncbi:ABC transporter [Thermus scotoductus]|uniref:ABC transporter n=1 Tax=Thermus scotoductus TaxID=37636 RepID=A0A430V5W2_THESC|nr:ABC transporter permease [Thermus thermophilus]RTH05243.1 ABC transporter [Thermus scotoductus]RTI17905.1 ABC transporter [Thermus scotoductus]RTI19818.1 ABC transporter [Thermus scotoductus]BCZ90720.1 hypothetical protein TthAA22_25250 [Thermus thermophilus]
MFWPRITYIEFWRFFRTLSRYPLELLGGVLAASVVFSLFFLGVHYLAGPALFGERLEALIVSLISWSLAFSLLSYTASTLTQESLAGLLEQLALTRPGLLGIVLVRAVLSLFQISLLIVPVVLAILLTSGARLELNSAAFLPLGALALSSLGLGLILGGLVLVYKRVDQLMGLLQFLLLGIFLVRFESLAWPWNILGYCLPLTPSVMTLRLLLGEGSVDVDGQFLFLLNWINTAVYLSFGVMFFKSALRKARKLGTLGIY